MSEGHFISSIEDRDGVLHASVYAADGEARMLATVGCLPSGESRIALDDAKKLGNEDRERVFVRIRSGEFLRPFRFTTD